MVLLHTLCILDILTDLCLINKNIRAKNTSVKVVYSHYFSSPGLSWDAMLKMTGIELQKIDNIDMHLILEKGIGGGVSYISKRYTKSDQNKTIMYCDANNLNGWAMI